MKISCLYKEPVPSLAYSYKVLDAHYANRNLGGDTLAVHKAGNFKFWLWHNIELAIITIS